VLKVDRRIQKLESTFGVSERFRHFVHRISFVDGNGKVSGTMVISSDPNQCVVYQELSEEKEGERS
jgi:hypothetical protein